MAFTSTEKFRILFYLGYSGFEDDGPAMRAINSLDSHEAGMGPIVRDLLDKLQQLDRDIHDLRDVAIATQTGSVQTRANYSLDVLWKMGRSLVGRLAGFTKIMVYTDVFSSGGVVRSPAHYSGD